MDDGIEYNGVKIRMIFDEMLLHVISNQTDNDNDRGYGGIHGTKAMRFIMWIIMF